MLRLIGAALVTLSASLVGFGFARGVQRRVRDPLRGIKAP